VRVVKKAFAYITRSGRLLVFRHPAFPDAGVQVPAGTIRSDETPLDAVVRESIEETGWTELGDPVFLGRTEFDCTAFGKAEIHERWFFHLEIGGSPPEAWRHDELDPEGQSASRGIEFSFFWIPLAGAELELIADHGSMLWRLREHLRSS
jgi:8-oxo-dGTP pyrophosphatase MutT (NUDIX family)